MVKPTELTPFIFKDPLNPGRGETVADVYQYNMTKIIDFAFDFQGTPYLLFEPQADNHPPGQVIEPGSVPYQAIEELLAHHERAEDDNCDDGFNSSERLPSFIPQI